MRDELFIEQETYRREQWEHLKHFRGKFDNEYPQTETILGHSEIMNKKKDIDKLLLNSIRLCIVNEELEKVFSYIDMLHFTQSLKLCIKLCESLNHHDLASKVGRYLQDKESREILMKGFKSTETNKVNQKIAEKKALPSHTMKQI